MACSHSSPPTVRSSASSAAESLVHRVPQDALGQAPVEAGEALGSFVINRENEAEVDRIPETSGVLDEGLADRLLVATEGAVSLADPVQVAPLAVTQALLAVRDVPDLVRGSFRVVVVLHLDEEHSASPLLLGRAGRLMQVSFRFGHGLLPLVGTDGAKLREQLVLVHLHPPALGRPVGQEAEHSERGRAEDVDRRPEAVDGFHEFVGPAAWDSFTLTNGLPRDREVVIGGAGAGDAVGLGVGVDLASKCSVNLEADEAEAARLCPGFPAERPPLRGTFLARDSGLRVAEVGVQATSESVDRRSCSTLLPRHAATRTRRFQALGVSSFRSRALRLSALHPETERQPLAIPSAPSGSTGPTTGKSFVRRGVDTERKAG